MNLEIYRDEAGFTALSKEWNELLKRSTSNTIFLTWEWQSTWWTHLGRGELFLLAMRGDDGSLLGLAPLYIVETAQGERFLSVVGCADVSDYLDIIAATCQEEAACVALFNFLASVEAPAWDAAVLCNLPESSPTCSMAESLAPRYGFTARLRASDVCPVINLPNTWEEYLATLDKKQRHELRRKMRKAERDAKIRRYIAGPEHDLSSEAEDFITLHQKSSAGKEEFMDERMKSFFRAMMQCLAERGWLQLSFLEINGEKAASMLCFDYNNEILVYNSGYDPRYAYLSPGLVLLSHCIQHAIALGRKRFDFLRGDEDYKFRFGGRETRIYQLVIYNERKVHCTR